MPIQYYCLCTTLTLLFSIIKRLDHPLCVQQLYLYFGLLLVNGVINSAPLRTLAKVAKLGVIWHFAGQHTLTL